MSELFTRLRNSDPITKRRWLIGLTSGCMVIVLIIWVVYLSFVLEPATEEVAHTEEQGFIASTFETIGSGFSDFGDKFSEVWSNLKEKFSKENEVTITATSTTSN